jgi:hypothetical protein
VLHQLNERGDYIISSFQIDVSCATCVKCAIQRLSINFKTLVIVLYLLHLDMKG